MKRLAVLLLSIVAVGAIVWVSVFGASGSRPKRDEPRPRPTTPRRRAKIRIAGHVQTKDGSPVTGATVFVLPKTRRGSNRDKADHEVTDRDGRWALWTRKTVGCWIGVVAAGYRNAYLDGDTVDASVQMFLVVEPAPAITVTLRDADGNPLRGRGVQVLPWPDSGAFYYLPGPNARQGEQWRVTDAAGEAVFRRGDSGPISLHADVEGWHADERKAWLADTAGEAVLTMRKNGSVALLLLDAETGARISGLATIEFFDPNTGAGHLAFTESTQRAGELRLARAIQPGTYGVQVELEGYLPGIHGPVTIDAAAQPDHALEVRLRRAVPDGTLALELVGNDGSVPAGARRRAPLTFLWRTDGRWPLRGWQPGAPDDWNAASGLLTYRLRPGTYDLLVADVLTGRAALEAGVEVTAGTRRRLQVAMKPGQRGRLPALFKDARVARELLAHDARNRRLPVFGGARGGRLRAGRAIDVIGRALEGEEVHLGPYPLDEFRLTLRSPGHWQDEVVFR